MSGPDLSSIEKKFQLTLKYLRFLHSENQKLKQAVQIQEDEIASQRIAFAEMEQKLKMLKMAAPSKDGMPVDTVLRKELRTTLNAYIHEIDNCIALLNK